MLVVSCLVLRKGTVGVLCETVGLLGRFHASYMYFVFEEMYPGYLFPVAQNMQFGSLLAISEHQGRCPLDEGFQATDRGCTRFVVGAHHHVA
jgi:hypothetical protein